jgi:hypothetical protein
LPPTEKKEVHRHMAVGGGYQYLLTSEGEEELYDLVADPNCQTNVAGTVEVPATLSEALQAQNAMTADYSELD